MTNEYAAALEKSNKASAEFGKVQQAYRNRTIGDAEYLAGRAKYEQSVVEFDAAFAKESA